MENKKSQEQLIEQLKGVIENLWKQLSGTQIQKSSYIKKMLRNIMLERNGIKRDKKNISNKEIEDLFDQLSGTIEEKITYAIRIVQNIMLQENENPEFIKVFKAGYDLRETAEEAGITKTKVARKKQKYDIWAPTRVKKFINKNPEASDEEIAIKANMGIAAVKSIRQEVNEINLKDAEIIKLAKAGYNQREITDKLGVTPAKVSRIRQQYGIWAPTKVKKFIRENPKISDEEIARKTNIYLETVKRLKEKAKNKYDLNNINPEDVELVKLAKAGYSQGKIARELQIKESEVSCKRKKYGIWSPTKVKSFIKENPETSDEEIAGQANIDIDTIKRLKEKAKNKHDLNNINTEDIEIIRLAKEGYKQKEIAQRLGIATSTVSNKERQYDILPPREVKKLINGNPELSNEEIARQANIDVDVVERLREEIEHEIEEKINMVKKHKDTKKVDVNSKPKKEKKTKAPTETKINGKVNVEKVPKKEERKAMEAKLKREDGKGLKTERNREESKVLGEKKPPKKQIFKVPVISEEIISKIRRELSNFPAIASIAGRLGVPKELVIQIKTQMDKEQYDRTHTEKNFRIKMQQLLFEVKRNSRIRDVSGTILTYKADTLLTEFSQFITTKEDYSLIAYAYFKAGKYQKAIEIGEQHLEIETPTLEGLQQKLQEVILQKEQKVQKTEKQERQVENITTSLKETGEEEHSI